MSCLQNFISFLDYGTVSHPQGQEQSLVLLDSLGLARLLGFLFLYEAWDFLFCRLPVQFSLPNMESMDLLEHSYSEAAQSSGLHTCSGTMA